MSEPHPECMQGVVPANADASASASRSGPPRSPQHLFPDDMLVRRRPRSVSLAFLRERELGGRSAPPHALVSWAEGESLRTLDIGTYVSLGSPPGRVRSTISIAFSHDGKYFASTHGDHSVKVFSYPACELQVSLEGHPRTPWSVRFHPTDASIVASGCLGGECRIWNVKDGMCIRKFRFAAKISCVAFSPAGDLLAVTAGAKLHLWRYLETQRGVGHAPPDPFRPRGDPSVIGMPAVLLSGGRDFHMVDFHPSGRLLLTGESNRPPANENQNSPPSQEDQFTLRLVVHRFDRRAATILPDPVLVVPRAVAYNDAGVHISPCGTRLAACVPVEPNSGSFHIAVLSFTAGSGQTPGTVLYSTPVDGPHVAALTNLKFSASGGHLLAGFSFPRGNNVLRELATSYDFSPQLPPPALWGQCGVPARAAAQVRVVDIFRVCEGLPLVRSLRADLERDEADGSPAVEDEINIAVFAPSGPAADGVLYGTQKGRIRVFRHAVTPDMLAHGICDENCGPLQQTLRLSSRKTALRLQLGSRRHN